MITCKTEGLDKLAENLRKEFEKQIVDEARRAGVVAKFVGNGKAEFSGPEDSVRRYLKLNPSLQAAEPDTSIGTGDIGVIDTDFAITSIGSISRRKRK
ncbi:MAG: hypothetical protein ACREDQ_02080 [Limisphaerales bacterium]